MSAADRAAGSSVNVSGSTSAKTTFAPSATAVLAVATNVIGGTTTSSPGPTPAAAYPTCSAAVPLDTAAQPAPPVQAARSVSNASTCGPVVSQSLRRAATTAATSSSVTDCRPYGSGAVTPRPRACRAAPPR
ncbi:hypothetical protein JD77_04260 [Micromonospora olivasterospora]|uniref:Uncharacterized protein n=1 Tax=Micromonospora olivasterospora TaxID=1880 RepID=A0A562IEC9_MICOL|nr:hypothetical protein JD77_04260 [Micromonospora olivasterospora]